MTLNDTMSGEHRWTLLGPVKAEILGGVHGLRT